MCLQLNLEVNKPTKKLSQEKKSQKMTKKKLLCLKLKFTIFPRKSDHNFQIVNVAENTKF